MKKEILACVIGPLLLAVSVNLWAKSDSLIFATLCSDEKPESAAYDAELKAWSAFTNNLSQRLGKKVTLSCKPTTADVLNTMEKGAVDMCYLTQVPFKALEKNSQKFQVIAIAMEADGSSKYRSIFVTRKGEKIALSDLKNTKMGLIQWSSSGEYLPIIALKNAHLYTPKNIKYYASYEDALAALQNEEVAGIFGADTVFDALVAPIDWQARYQESFVLSPDLPSPLFVVNRDKISDKTIEELKDVLPKAQVNVIALRGFKRCSKACPTLSEFAVDLSQASIQSIE